LSASRPAPIEVSPTGQSAQGPEATPTPDVPRQTGRWRFGWLAGADLFSLDGPCVNALRMHIHAGYQPIHQILAIHLELTASTVVVRSTARPSPSLDYEVVVPLRIPPRPLPLRPGLFSDRLGNDFPPSIPGIALSWAQVTSCHSCLFSHS